MPNMTDYLPKYMQIADQLRQQIIERYTTNERRLPPVRDLCKEYGVSVDTMRQALSVLSSEGIIRGTRGKGTFILERPTANREKNASATGESRGADIKLDEMFIGLAYADIMAEFGYRMFRSLDKTLCSQGYHYAFGNNGGDPHRELAYLRTLEKLGTATILAAPTQSNAVNPTYRKEICRIIDSGIVVIFTNLYLPEVPTPVVATDNYASMKMAMRHITDLGHRHIGFIGGTVITGDRDRWRGAVDGLREAGIEPDMSLLMTMPIGPDGNSQPYWPARNLLARTDRPTAIVCNNDVVAMEVFKAAGEMGIRIPEDLSIIGFDDLAECSHLNPPLTTIRQDFEGMGKIAAEEIIQLWAEKERSGVMPKLTSHRFRLIEGTLIVRQSTAPLRQQTKQ